MKRLFSFMAIAMVAVAAFAFTPKSSALLDTYHYDTVEQEWVTGNGPSCPGGTDACEFTSDLPITNPAAFANIEAAIAINDFSPEVDTDGDSDVETVQLSSVLKFDR